MTNDYKKLKGRDLYYMSAGDHHPANTYFHFSFADYYNPENMNFGSLRVLNDDDIKPHSGFDKHPHRNMEIISYIIKGELTHWDNAAGVKQVIKRGHVQAITAGSGVWHSEHNEHDGWTRLLQIWILPPAERLAVRYEQYEYEERDRKNKLLHIVGNLSNKDQAKLHINQDVNLYISELTDEHAMVEFSLKEGRQAYVNNFEGQVEIKAMVTLDERDSLEITGPAKLQFIHKGENSHFIIIEMPYSPHQ